MFIFPAIDLKDGLSVRLYQGDFNKKTIVNPDPVAQARTFENAGARYLHIVDLDGAVQGASANLDVVANIVEAVNIPVQLGGGIRTIAQIQALLKLGVSRVILGSIALQAPELVEEAITRFGTEKIVVGIDARAGKVATEGWLETSTVSYLDLAQEMVRRGVTRIVYTDIGRDGTMSGPNLMELTEINAVPGLDVIASGGISSKADLLACSQLGLYGVISGKALYEGKLTMAEVVEVENNAN